MSWARGASKARPEAWDMGDVLRFKRVVRHKMLKNVFDRNHELIFAGRFFEVQPDKHLASKFHTVLVVSYHEKNKEAYLWKVKLRPDGETVMSGGVEQLSLEHLGHLGPYECNLVGMGQHQDIWFNLHFIGKSMSWAPRTRTEYACFIWCLYQAHDKLVGSFPRSSIDVNELEKTAQTSHFKYLFDCLSWSCDAKPLVGGEEGGEGRLFTAQEEKEIDNVLKDFDIDSSKIAEFEQQAVDRLGAEENSNIKRFLEAQQVAKATHGTLERAQTYINEIEARMKLLEKDSLRRPTKDLREFREDSALLAIQSKNELNLLSEISSVLNRLQLEDDEEELLKKPFVDGETKNLPKLVATIEKLIAGISLNQESRDGLKLMNIVREKLDEFVRLSVKLNDATEVFMKEIFRVVQGEAMAEDFEPAQYFPSTLREGYVDTGTYGHKNLRHLTEFMRKFCQLEEMLQKRNKDCLNFELSESYASAFGAVYAKHFAALCSHVLKQSADVTRNCGVLEMQLDGIPGQRTAYVGCDLYKVSENGQLLQGTPWLFTDLLADDSSSRVPQWVAITTLLKLFLDQAYTESRFLDKFFSLAGDTDNDAQDKFNLMYRLYNDLTGHFRAAIDQANSNCQHSVLVLSLLVAKVRGLCDMSEMVMYLQHFLTELEMRLQFLLNKYIDGQIETIQDDSPSASSAGVLRAVTQMPLFFEHLVATSEMVAKFPFLQAKQGDADDEEDDQYEQAPSSWLAQNLLAQRNDEDEQRQRAERRAVESLQGEHGEGEEDEEDEQRELVGEGTSDLVGADEKFNLYVLDGVVHKMVVAVFNQIENIAHKDVRYTNVVLLQNFFAFATLFSKPGFLRPLGATLAPYVKKAKLQYFTAADEYVRWLVTSELRMAMAYFDEVDALLKSRRQTPQEIHYCHPFKEFKHVVDTCLTEHKIEALLHRIFQRVLEHLSDWLVVACVCQKVEYYLVMQFSKYLDITKQCFPPYMSCFGDLKVEDLRPSSPLCPLSKELISRQLFELCVQAQKDPAQRVLMHHQWLDVEMADGWYMEAPVDIRKPEGPRRKVKGSSAAQVKAKLLEGHSVWPERGDEIEEFEVTVDDKPDQ